MVANFVQAQPAGLALGVVPHDAQRRQVVVAVDAHDVVEVGDAGAVAALISACSASAVDRSPRASWSTSARTRPGSDGDGHERSERRVGRWRQRRRYRRRLGRWLRRRLSRRFSRPSRGLPGARVDLARLAAVSGCGSRYMPCDGVDGGDGRDLLFAVEVDE